MSKLLNAENLIKLGVHNWEPRSGTFTHMYGEEKMTNKRTSHNIIMTGTKRKWNGPDDLDHEIHIVMENTQGNRDKIRDVLYFYEKHHNVR